MDTATSSHEECRQEIERHRDNVLALLSCFSRQLLERARTHDLSKLEEPQFEVFANLPRNRGEIQYGSAEYLDRLTQLQPALEHHYASERHHPEHFHDGVAGMHLVDLVEMFADWLVTHREYGTGSLADALDLNRTRFNVSDQLHAIFTNTAVHLHQRKEIGP